MNIDLTGSPMEVLVGLIAAFFWLIMAALPIGVVVYVAVRLALRAERNRGRRSDN